MQKIDWELTCSKCIFGDKKTVVPGSKGHCSHKHPDTYYDSEKGWLCNSFVRRWNTKEDLEQSKHE